MKIEELTKKQLDSTYISLNIIKNDITIKKSDVLQKISVYTFIAIDINSTRQLLEVQLDRPNSVRFWIEIFEKFKSRGVNNFLFLAASENKELKKAAKISFPQIVFIDSIVEIALKFHKYSNNAHTSDAATDIRRLYIQKSLADYKNCLVDFSKKYNSEIQKKLITKYLGNVESSYKYSFNIREIIFNYCRNMLIYDKIRIKFKDEYIENVTDVVECLNENLDQIVGQHCFSKKIFNSAINDLICMYEDIDFI